MNWNIYPGRSVTNNLLRIKAGIAFLVLASVVFVGIPTSAFASIPGEATSPATTKSREFKMWPSSFMEMKSMSAEQRSGVATAKSARSQEAVYYAIGVEFKTPAARQRVFTDLKRSNLAGAFVLTTIGPFADVFVQTDNAYMALKNNPDVIRVELMSAVNAPPPPDGTPSAVQTLAVPESIIRGGHKGLTGKGVIIAVLDTGVDFRHPDFITYDAQGKPASRLKYLWDTGTDFQTGRGSMSPVKFPNGGSIGTLYTQEQLTAELRNPTGKIPATDVQGHGTACASIAAGNGNADRATTGLKRKEVEGVAPEADIIGVTMGPEGTFRNGYLIGAINEWLDNVAGKTPLVVSGSFGGHYTGHDGQTVRERHINARFPLNQAGRAIVIAAGNEGADGIHAKLSVAGEPKPVSWFANEQTDVRIYFDGDDKFTIYGSDNTAVTQQNIAWDYNPYTRQWAATLKVQKGLGSIAIKNLAGRSSEVHLYLYDDAAGTFAPANVTYSHLIGSPGSAENAITVGSYDWNNSFHFGGSSRDFNDPFGKPITIGWLSTYSSRGPLRAGNGTAPIMKPEIVAPGQYYASAAAKVGGQSVAGSRSTDSTGSYRLMNGTSAATPYTSGVIALMFQKKPTLTLGQIKDLLKTKSSKAGLNPFTQALPSIDWGYGKLDVAAVDNILSSL